MNTRKTSILASLTASGNKFSRTLEKIALFMRENPEKIVYNTITQTAELISASETSIVRFCRQMGFSSYAEFKMALALELNQRNFSQESDGLDTPQKGGIKEQRLVSAIEGLKNTASLINEESILKAAQWIVESNNTIVVGVASSFTTAFYLDYQLGRIGFVSRCFSDTHMANINAAHFNEKSLIICVSSGGSSKEVIESVKTAKNAGGRTIGITNSLKSPLSSYLDLTLIASNAESPLSGGSYCAKINQFFLVELIISTLMKVNPQCNENLEKSANSVTNLLC